jgi:hypothetical protein
MGMQMSASPTSAPAAPTGTRRRRYVRSSGCRVQRVAEDLRRRRDLVLGDHERR